MATGLLLFLLLIAPASALFRSTNDHVVLAVISVGWLIVNIVTYTFYTLDKRRARAGAWRVPETTLHLLALFGGWPAALLAQRRLGHKTSKTRFQVVFWLIVVSHELVAADALLDWRFIRAASETLRLSALLG